MENKNFVWVITVIALAAGFLGGQWYGKRTGMQQANQKVTELQKSLDVFVPPLPDIVNIISGKIIAVSGDAFTLEIPSLTDRYPKPGIAMKTETKTIRMTADTKITSISFDPKTFKNGVPQAKTISVGDLKAGDAVSITVKENARAEPNLTAVNINKAGGM